MLGFHLLGLLRGLQLFTAARRTQDTCTRAFGANTCSVWWLYVTAASFGSLVMNDDVPPGVLRLHLFLCSVCFVSLPVSLDLTVIPSFPSVLPPSCSGRWAEPSLLGLLLALGLHVHVLPVVSTYM